MEFVKTYKNNYHSTVFLFSDPNSFSLYLLENLLSNLCNVVVFSDNPKLWRENIYHITKSARLIIDQKNNIKNYPNPDYFISSSLTGADNTALIKDAFLFTQRFKAKGLIVLKEENLKTEELNLPDSVGVILLDNLFGPRMEINNESRISQILLSAINNKKIKLYRGEKLHPLYLKEAAKVVIKWLFSFGHYGEVVVLSAQAISTTDFCVLVGKVFPNFKYQILDKDPKPPDFEKKNTYLLNKIDTKTIEETLIWIKHNHLGKKLYQKENSKKVKPNIIILCLLLLLVLPYTLILISAGLLYLSYKSIRSQNLSTTSFVAKSSTLFSNASSLNSRIYSNIPLLGTLYKPAFDISNVFKDLNYIGEGGISLISNFQILMDGIAGENKYDLVKASRQISSDLKDIETKLSFIETDVKNYSVLNKINNKINIASARKKITGLAQISSQLTDILGENGSKTYLILLQNNMELRPTGGFIGSFALVSLTSGKIDEIIVQDVYSADGQLKGHVEPPNPIKKYLKEANWFLRDSNWDPDFPSSAEKAKWFLDKEIDVQVDGVISLDLNIINDILSLIGPIFLSDYQISISAENFYEKTQSEAEDDFFPGSTQKASFITALTREILNTILINNQINKIDLAKIIYENLQARHIQIYLDNKVASEAVGGLNWDGSINYLSCSENCYSDFAGLVEANLGVNKANYFIKRNSSLYVDLKEDSITKTLTVDYKNDANRAMENGGVYKVYARLLTPKDAVVNYIKVGENIIEVDTETVKDRKETGFYFEVFPEQAKKLTISWQNKTWLNFDQAGEYRMYLRKQAGISEEPITIVYDSLSGVDLSVKPGYNTLFSKDINSVVTWKK